MKNLKKLAKNALILIVILCFLICAGDENPMNPISDTEFIATIAGALVIGVATFTAIRKLNKIK